MQLSKSIPHVLMGAVIGISLVIACGDDDGSPIDAADAADPVCDCDPAEPPLTGRIVVRQTTVSVPPNDTTEFIAGCNTGEQILGGGCRYGASDDSLVLHTAGFSTVDGGVWECIWTSTETIALEAFVQTVCLVPQ